MALYTNTRGITVEADTTAEAQKKIEAEVKRVEAEKNSPKKQEQKTIESPKPALESGQKKEVTEKQDGE